MDAKPLIKYIGNKYRSAAAIIDTFPRDFETYFEPFAGSLAVLGQLQPRRAVVSDTQEQLIALWKLVQARPKDLADSYAENWAACQQDSPGTYSRVKARYNSSPNPHDFLFISRTCYGGVMRFRRDGYISTPIGPHKAMPPETFSKRLAIWHRIVRNCEFIHGDFESVVGRAGRHDLVYCDPPYSDSQKIIYGAQDFTLGRLFTTLERAKQRGAYAVLSIDGRKKSGQKDVPISPPAGLFDSISYLALGGSMLKRFWRDGMNVNDEHVHDRLLHSYVVAQRNLFPAVA